MLNWALPCLPRSHATLSSANRELFAPNAAGKDLKASEAAHEARLAALLQLGPGKKALDCGCGVGGPMRTIASVSGAHVTGITINEYQVGRAKLHNAKVSAEASSKSFAARKEQPLRFEV